MSSCSSWGNNQSSYLNLWGQESYSWFVCIKVQQYVVVMTTVTHLPASYKTTVLSRHVGYTQYFTEKKGLFLQLLYLATQIGDATFPSESNTALAQIYFPAALDSEDKTSAGERSKSELKDRHIKFLSWCSQKFTHQRQLLPLSSLNVSFLIISPSQGFTCSMLSPHLCTFTFPRLVFHLKKKNKAQEELSKGTNSTSRVVTQQPLYHTNGFRCSFSPWRAKTGHAKPKPHKLSSNHSHVSQESCIFRLNQHAADEVGVFSHVGSEPLIHRVVFVHLPKANTHEKEPSALRAYR